MQHETLFEQLSPTRLFARCALPSMVSMAMTSLYTVADGIFVGRYVGSDALAAVNLVMPVIMMGFALSDMIAVGSSVQISIHLGEKKPLEANRIFSFCSALIVAISCVVGLAGWFLAEPILRLMGADGGVTALAVSYLRVYAAFAPLVTIYFAVDNYLRICGKVRYSMGLNVFTALLNLVLDYLFLVVLGRGVAAAAVASCLSLGLGTVLGYAPFLAKKLPLRFVRGRPPLARLGRLLANGSSEFFSSISGSITMLLFNSVLLGLAGSTAVAAFSIVMYVSSVVGSLLFGMADALQPAISYNYGAGNRSRMFALEARVLAAGAAVSLVTMVLLRLGGGGIVSLFIQAQDTALLDMSLRAMALFALSYLTDWAATALSSFFTALNRPGLSLSLAFSRALLFPVVCLTVLPRLWGLDGVWLTPFAASLFSALLSAVFLCIVLRQERTRTAATGDALPTGE